MTFSSFPFLPGFSPGALALGELEQVVKWFRRKAFVFDRQGAESPVFLPHAGGLLIASMSGGLVRKREGSGSTWETVCYVRQESAFALKKTECLLPLLTMHSPSLSYDGLCA